MSGITIRYLSGHDVARLELTDDEILEAQLACLTAQGNGETVIEPRMHLQTDPAYRGHFNVLRGYIAPLDVAGIKVVGDFVDNYKLGYPSEFGTVTLMDPRTGAPRAIVDGTGITDMRTGAMTAIGARFLAPDKPRVLGHIGARGSSYWNVRLLDHLFDFEEIRVHSRRPESRQGFAQRLTTDLNKPVVATENWEECLDGADIIVEATRLEAPEPLFDTRWIRPGALVVPYGTNSTVQDDILEVVDKVVVDHWAQCLVGPFGCLRRFVDSGEVTEDSIHGELGSICAGHIPGRERSDETILFWHRGLSISDISLAQTMLDKAERLDIGHTLPYA